MENGKLKIRMFRDYLVNCLCLQKINLKKPYLEAVALRFTFVWNAGEIEYHAKIFIEFLFSKTAY